jgi:hypothetical protein
VVDLGDAQPELRPGDQRDRAAADSVVEGDHLRHRGHLHAERGGHPDRGADQQPADDQAPVADAVKGQRDPDRDGHAEGGDQVAALGGGGVGPLPHAHDEEDEGDDVGGADDVGVRRQARDDGRGFDHCPFPASSGVTAFGSVA